MSNRNTLYSEILVEELLYAGIKHICLAPGSRNTPLVMAFASRPEFKLYSHLDERSAAFFALGIGIATDEPAVLVCTSGTAAANFFPAIIEAHQSRVPMLVLTADRPHELRESGANQTINQIEIFGHYALWSVDMALPEATPAEVVIRNLRATMARAVATATGQRKGVVHLNVPFRKPLEPIPDPNDSFPIPPRQRSHQAPYVTYHPSQTHTNLSFLPRDFSHGIIICGPRTIRGNNPAAQAGIQALAQFTGYPVIADPLSGMRFGYPEAISSYETFLRHTEPEPPDCIIRLGDIPTSKFLGLFLEKTPPQTVIHLTEDGIWADDQHRISEVMRLDLATLTELAHQPPATHTAYKTAWQTLEQKTWANVAKSLEDDERLFDGAIVYDAVRLLPPETTLLAGNSLSVRHLDQFGQGTEKPFFAYASRGASGIDGNLSTAFGLGAGRRGMPLVAIVGDITFYHDMNGLLAAKRCGIPIIIVLLNNNGGGIFHRLPIREFDPQFTEYFLTPHDLDFSHAARLYGLDYHLAASRADFRQAFIAALAGGGSTIIEVQTNAEQDLKTMRKIVEESRL